MLSRFYGAEDGVFAPEHLRGLDQITLRHRAPDRGAAHDLSVYLYRLDPDHAEIVNGAELFQQRKISRASLAERPLVANANFAKWTRIRHKLANKFLGRGCGELPIESQNEKMGDSEIAEERDFVLRRRQQMGRILWTQHLCGVGVERNHHQCATRVFGVARRSGDDRLMTEMNSVKDADG